MVSTQMIIVLCSLIFMAGFIDSIAGGGGLISLPAYLFIGLPAHNALASNKFSSSVGTTISTARFFKNKALDVKVATISAIVSFMGGYMGSSLALVIPDDLLKKIFVMVMPIIAILIFSKKSFGVENQVHLLDKNKKYIFAGLIGGIIGFYDGLIGPGTGTFAIIAYSFIMKYDLKTASGNAKLLNLASNYASLVAFLMSDKIIFHIAIPAAIAGLCGNYIGSGYAIKKGHEFIRPMMIFVTIGLFAKIGFDVFGQHIIKLFS